MGPPEINISMCRTVRAAVIRSGLHRVFVNRVERARENADKLVIVSPWITPAGDGGCRLAKLIELIKARRIPTYVFTRKPRQPEHLDAVEMFKSCPTAEVVFNDNIHAKIYTCLGRPPHAFGLMGSANFTANSLLLYEIGLLIIGEGPGLSIVEDLGNFGMRYLRTRPESDVIKKIDYRGIRR